MRLALAAALAAPLAFMAPASALASICYAYVKDIPGVRYANLGPFAYTPKSVTITFVTHSTFRIETDAGITIATDFNGYAGTGAEGKTITPDVVTMNHAHSTHYTDYPDPAIPHVLRGWDADGTGPAAHMLELEDVTIRNVTTDIRGWGAPEIDGNSIFVFEVADFCIGHLGHLHHMLDEAHFAKLGRLDVVMAAVDGSTTLDLPSMIELLKRLKARVVLPMHIFSMGSLQYFLNNMRDEFRIDTSAGPSITLSLESLPSEPTVVVLQQGVPDIYD